MKKKLSLLLVGLLLSFSAAAILPLGAIFAWQMVGAATYSLVNYLAAQMDYAKAQAKLASGKTVKIAMITNSSVSPAAIAESEAVLPPSRLDADLVPPYRFTFSRTTSSGPVTYTAVGSTFSEFKASLAQCPSTVCTGNVINYGSTFTAYDNTSDANIQAAIANLSAAESVTIAPLSFTDGNYRPQRKLEVRITHRNPSSSTSTTLSRLFITPPSYYCPSGYTYNSSAAVCDVTDVTAASVSSGDGVCPVFGGFPAAGDPDCDALSRENKLTQSRTADGEPVTSILSSDNVYVSQVYRGEPGSIISQVLPSGDGGKRREDTFVAATGVIGPTNLNNYPSSPPPIYPGDSGGTLIPGAGSVTTTAAPCGSPGQPACSVKLEGSSGSPLEGLGDGVPAGLSDSLGVVKQKASVLPVSATCPPDMFSFTLPLPAAAGGDYRLADNGLFCRLMGDYQEVIRGLSIAFGFIMATFIVLGA